MTLTRTLGLVVGATLTVCAIVALQTRPSDSGCRTTTPEGAEPAADAHARSGAAGECESAPDAHRVLGGVLLAVGVLTVGTALVTGSYQPQHRGYRVDSSESRHPLDP